MKSSSPLISILISTKNHAAYLQQCLASLQRQTFKDFEVLVFDDGSNDETPMLLDEISRYDQRFSFFREEQSVGCLIRFNQLFRLASGGLIWGVGSDDFCHDPYFLSKGVQGLKDHPDAAGFFSATNALHMPSERKGKIWGPGGPDRLISANGMMQSFFANQEASPGPSCVLKSHFFKKEQGLDLSLGPQSDYFINNLAGGTNGFFYMSNPAVTFRVWDDAASFSASQSVFLNVRRLAMVEGKLRTQLPSRFSVDSRWLFWRNYQLISLFNLTHRLHLLSLSLLDFILIKYKRQDLFLDLMSLIDQYTTSFNEARQTDGLHVLSPLQNRRVFTSLAFSFCRIKFCGFFSRIANSTTKRLLGRDYVDIKRLIFYVR